MKACAQGRSEYWFGPSVDATAHAAHLLEEIEPGRHSTIVTSCVRFVLEAQNSDGGWSSTWFPSRMPTTYHAIRLLKRSEESAEGLERARNFILSTQTSNGSWRDSVIETAGAVLALSTLDPTSSAIERGRAWIRSKRSPQGWSGEPVLHYWFEIGPHEKLFFHCRDTGEVTTAWARLALEGNDARPLEAAMSLSEPS